MANEALQLAILLTLKDAASGGLDRFQGRLRSLGAEGEKFHNEFQKIRDDLSRDLAVGGVGVASLAAMRKGVDIAADFQSAMTELRTTFSQLRKDGSVDMDLLGKDMLRAEAIALDLGNRLPGTTKDFVQMLQAARQTGVSTETIFAGAGKAIGELAVATNQAPADVAKYFGQFMQLYNIQGKDAVKAADTISRLYTSTGINPGELIEASKYFQGRSGQGIGISGLDDATQMTRLFGLFRKSGMEGSMAGTAMDNLITQYLSERKKADDAAKQFGLNLEFFDDKGNFQGIDNLFKQLEPLRKLSEKDRSQAALAMFGMRGQQAAMAIINAGTDGWKKFNEEQDRTIGLLDLNAEKSKDFSNQMEALTGSVENLVVTAFEPMLPSLTSLTTGLNEVVGGLQGFAKENPGLLKTLGTIALYGSTAMVAYSGFKTLTAGVKMFKVASAFSRGQGLLPYLTQTAAAASTANASVATLSAGANTGLSQASTQARGFRNSLNAITGSRMFKVGLTVTAIAGLEYAVTRLVNGYLSGREFEAGISEKRQSEAKLFRGEDWIAEFYGRGSYGGGSIAKTNPSLAIGEGRKMFERLNQRDSELVNALRGESPHVASMPSAWGFVNPLYHLQSGAVAYDNFAKATGARNWEGWTGSKIGPADWWEGNNNGRVGNRFTDTTGRLDQEALARALRSDDLQSIRSPSGMAGLLHHSRRNLPADQFEQFRGGVEKAYPDVYKQAEPLLAALQQYAQSASGHQQATLGFIESLSSLQQPMQGTAELFSGLPQPMTDTAMAFQNLQGPTNETADAFGKIAPPANRLPGAFNNIFSSANSAANSLGLLGSRLSSWQPPASSIGSPTGLPAGTPSTGVPSIFTPPGFAVGGRIKRSGLAMVHADEEIVPAKAVAFRERRDEAKTAPVVINFSPQITINGGSETSAEDLRRALARESRHIEEIVTRGMQRARYKA